MLTPKIENGVILGLRPEDIDVAINPGHGTREFTPGKRSADGRYFEGEWARMVAPKLANALRDMGFNAWQVVTERYDVGLLDRCRRANKHMREHPDKYHIYIALHSNAAPGEKCVRGWADDISGLSVYITEKASTASEILARRVYEAGCEMGCKGNRSAPGHLWTWRACFTEVTQTEMPAILTENLFHTNRKEVDFLLSEAGQDTIVNYHLAGICRAFGIPTALCTGKRF